MATAHFALIELYALLFGHEFHELFHVLLLWFALLYFRLFVVDTSLAII